MGYFCPQCQAKYCSLPVECEICGLLLAMAPHLARSYQRYFPLNSFQEINVECAKCMGCNELITDSVGFVCDRCEGVYCEDCDITTHDTLAFCPACSLEE
ncbi:General transcription factor IIH subunit 2 [Thelohanellus kitauei]|uniref:General transcription factor IIH subunit 2 n=1 Tax=Thelohanellus kitauei TaxID=669202 RepID=A0A0C2JRD8_THEKT|nr:General transcription factor IIH subunit 2 [Thelohanellus kitauei]